MKTSLRVLSLALLIGSHGYSYAYTSVMDTGEIMPANQYKLTGETQFITNEDGGLNLGGRFDGGINEDMGFRAEVGFGKTDVFLGGMFKYMPFPDTDTQPALGFNTGILYGRNGSNSETTLRFEPLVSKQFKASFGKLTPYASLPLGVVLSSKDIRGKKDTNVEMQLAFGSQVKTNKWDNLQFIGEVGLNLKDAFSYISLGVVYYYDVDKGFVLR